MRLIFISAATITNRRMYEEVAILNNENYPYVRKRRNSDTPILKIGATSQKKIDFHTS